MNKKISEYMTYFFVFVIFISALCFCLKNKTLNDFLNTMEDKTFDIRQNLLLTSHKNKVSKDIMILTIDDASYEYLHEKYGEWPIPRGVYADLINYLEKQSPKAIAFDLMFVKSMKSSAGEDAKLVSSIIKNNNVYTSMNLDDQPQDVRKPVQLDEKFEANVNNNSKINFSDVTFTNCRTILPAIMSGTDKIGMTNVSRSGDGVLRKVPPLMMYNGKYYPHLALLLSQKAIDGNVSEYAINKNNNLIAGQRTIPLDKDGGAILNWYGQAGKTYTYIPLYKVVKAMYGASDEKFNFENKIIYIGTTAVSLYDTKTVPVDKLYPGVEIHTTFVNNFINNDFIRKATPAVNIAICIILALLTGYFVFKISTVAVSVSATLAAAFGYVILTYFMMKFANIWMAIVYPVVTLVFVFIVSYIAKYILKSRDFDHQYKLATTDGLTEIYNHRYFQEQMDLQIANSKRYNLNFSLIMTDIDFFKKFNDIFGHQSGDAVLKQVAAKLKKHVRSSDFVCRYGGEEMAIILPNTDHEEAYKTAEKLCKLIAERPFKLANNKESAVTISLGVSTYPKDGETKEDMIAAADKRLYNAKENGRNQVGI